MKKNMLIGPLITFIIFVFITFMSIGYSALNSNLSITADAIVEIQREIKITDMKVLSVEEGAYTTYNPTFTNSTSNISVTLPNENSTITIVVEVSNNTNDNYHLDIIEGSTNNNLNITYEILNKEILYCNPNSVT